jgi:hypothetical protein
MNEISKVLRSVIDINWNPETLEILAAGGNEAIGTATLGVGCNSFRAHLMAQAVDRGGEEINHIEFSDSYFKSIESVKELRKALSLDVEVSYSGLVFSADASLSYFESSEFNSYDYYVLARMTIRTKSHVLNGGDLTQQAQADARVMSADDFFRKYGDCFIRRIDYGGELYGLMHVRTQFEAQKSALNASLSASGGGASLEMKFSQTFEAMSHVGEVTVLFMKTGGQPAFVDQTNFISQLRGFAAEVSATERAVSFVADSYDIVNWPNDAPPKADYTLPRKYFMNAQDLAAKCQDQLNDAKYVLDHQDLFDFSTVPVERVQAITDFLQTTIQDAETKVDEIADHPTTTQPMPPVDLSKVILPKRIVTLSLPNVWTWVGVQGIGLTNGDSGTFAGFGGTPLDSFGIQKIPGEPLDVAFSYSGRFLKWTLGGADSVTFSSGNGGKCGADSGICTLLAVAVSLGGRDAYLFDVLYQFRLKDGTKGTVGTNGSWLEATNDNPPDGLKVWLTFK